jgi:hypothetical protein
VKESLLRRDFCVHREPIIKVKVGSRKSRVGHVDSLKSIRGAGPKAPPNIKSCVLCETAITLRSGGGEGCQGR